MNAKMQEQLGFIFGRRSIREYSSNKVTDEVVQKLLEAAMAAPSAVAKDPWRFVVVRNRQKLSQITVALPNGQMLAGVSGAEVEAYLVAQGLVQPTDRPVDVPIDQSCESVLP